MLPGNPSIDLDKEYTYFCESWDFGRVARIAESLGIPCPNQWKDCMGSLSDISRQSENVRGRAAARPRAGAGPRPRVSGEVPGRSYRGPPWAVRFSRAASSTRARLSGEWSRMWRSSAVRGAPDGPVSSGGGSGASPVVASSKPELAASTSPTRVEPRPSSSRSVSRAGRRGFSPSGSRAARA